MTETRRRTVVKTVAWRVIGIVWIWVGAYLILLLTPERYRTEAALATFIVAFHHSTRMVMYYAYERLWGAIVWGRCEGPGCAEIGEATLAMKAAWTAAVVAAIALLLAVVLYVTPRVKP